MLGKCIKNEFVNRWKQVAALLGGILLFSVIVLIMNILDDHVIKNNTYSAVVMITQVVYAFALVAVIVAMVLLPSVDFSRRFFKDQGYLTNTLPVKTSTMVMGRMVCDLCMVILAVLVYPLAIGIASGREDFFRGMINSIASLYDMFDMTGTGVDRVLVAAIVVAAFIAVFLGILFSLWQINTAYAFGHIFNRGKRLLSVVAYFILWVIFELVMILLNKIVNIPGVNDWISNIVDGIETSAGSMLLVLSVIDVGMLIGVVVLAISTAYILKHHLNLE